MKVKSDLRELLKWKIAGSGSVIPVIPSVPLAFFVEYLEFMTRDQSKPKGCLGFLGSLFGWLADDSDRNAPESPSDELDWQRYRTTPSTLMTETEKVFFRSLLNAIDGAAHIFAKVRLEDIAEVAPGPSRFSLRSRVKSRHIDFLLVSTSTLTPILAIELDDKTHRVSKSRIDADAFKDRLFQEIGIALLRFHVEDSFDHLSIRERIRSELSPARES